MVGEVRSSREVELEETTGPKQGTRQDQMPMHIEHVIWGHRLDCQAGRSSTRVDTASVRVRAEEEGRKYPVQEVHYSSYSALWKTGRKGQWSRARARRGTARHGTVRYGTALFGHWLRLPTPAPVPDQLCTRARPPSEEPALGVLSIECRLDPTCTEDMADSRAALTSTPTVMYRRC